MRFIISLICCCVGTASFAEDAKTFYRLKDENRPAKGTLEPARAGAPGLVFKPCEGNPFPVQHDDIEKTLGTCGDSGTMYAIDESKLKGKAVVTWDNEIIGTITSIEGASRESLKFVISPTTTSTSKAIKIPVEDLDLQNLRGNDEVMYLQNKEELNRLEGSK